jgi:hypothetical protein
LNTTPQKKLRTRINIAFSDWLQKLSQADIGACQGIALLAAGIPTEQRPEASTGDGGEYAATTENGSLGSFPGDGAGHVCARAGS